MSRLQARDNGMACLTIDSIVGQFCYYCGTKENLASKEASPGICICLECGEAKRLDDIDAANLKKEASAMPVFLRALMETLRHVPGTYGIDDGTIDELRNIAQHLEAADKARQAPTLFTMGITV